MKFSVIFKESISNLRRFKELTFQSIGILAVALFLLGIYFIIVSNVSSWLRSLESKVEISCYLSEKMKEPEIKTLLVEIEAERNVAEVVYISKNAAMINFVKDPEIGEQIKILGENPLPASLSIKLKNKSPALVEDFVNHLKNDYKYSFEEISYAKDEIKNLSEAFAWIKYGGSILGIIFFSLTLLLLVFTLKIGRAERQDELRIMRLMGGEDDFLIKPFFYEGLITGILGFVVSFAILFLSFQLFNLKFKTSFMTHFQALVLFILSLVIPYICDFFVLGKFKLK